MFTIDIEEGGDVRLAVDRLRQLALDGSIQSHVHIANAFQAFSLFGQYPSDCAARSTSIPAPRFRELKQHHGLSEWSAIGGIYGSSDEVRARQRVISRAFEGIGSLRFFDADKVRGIERLVGIWRGSGGRGPMAGLAKFIKSLLTRKDFELVAMVPELYRVLEGKPTWAVLRSAYFRNARKPATDELDPARDGCGVIWLAPAIPMTGRHVEKALSLAESIFGAFDFNMSACLTMMNQRTLFLLLGIFFDQTNADERTRANSLHHALHVAFANEGYQHYRSGIAGWREAPTHASSGRTMIESIKATLDPARILAPGRYHV